MITKFMNLINNRDMVPEDIFADYLTISFAMFVLLYVARKTAKDLLLYNMQQQDEVSNASQIRNSDLRNTFEEAVFEGDSEDSENQQLALMTNNKTA